MKLYRHKLTGKYYVSDTKNKCMHWCIPVSPIHEMPHWRRLSKMQLIGNNFKLK